MPERPLYMTRDATSPSSVVSQRKMDIMCLQETKWTGGSTRRIVQSWKVYNSGGNEKKNGVGIILEEN